MAPPHHITKSGQEPYVGALQQTWLRLPYTLVGNSADAQGSSSAVALRIATPNAALSRAGTAPALCPSEAILL